MSTPDTKRTRTPAQVLKGIAREQLMMLIIQLLAGIAVVFIGMPMETRGFPKIASAVLLGIHVLVAIAMVTGAIRSLRPAAQVGSAAGLSWAGFAVVLLTFAAGVLTMITGSDWWSYLMAAGATALLVIYGLLYERATR